jgi:hypothetical protein
LADGNRASVGDLIITRSNDRRLRITATDWVKNGDRWIVLNVTRKGGLRGRHVWSGRTITLPADYVRAATELGYASTVHTTQGVTADAMHGVVTGEESRQQLYTMLTRGRMANHIYLSVVGDGDPHMVLQPDNQHPRTATELLEQILARDATPQSAITLQREEQDPAGRLGAAAARYLDSLNLAAERLTDRQLVAGVDIVADGLLNGPSWELAWPTLRGQLPLLAAASTDPVPGLSAPKLETSSLVGIRGPLPWLPGIPEGIAADPNWGPYLHARSHLVAQLADQVRLNAVAEVPAWAARLQTPVPAELIADVQVWRAAIQLNPCDLRPTGPPEHTYASRMWQQQLDKRLAATNSRADRDLQRLLATEVPSTTTDPFLPELADRVRNVARAGLDATLLVRTAAAAGPLPDDHPAAALWWRILDQLSQRTTNHHSAPGEAASGARPMTTTSQQPPTPRLAPPPALGPRR